MDERFIIVGAGLDGRVIGKVLAAKNPSQIIGYLDDQPNLKEVIVPNGKGTYSFKVLGRTDRLIDIIKSFQPTGIVNAITHNPSDHFLAEIIRCYELEIPVYLMHDLYAKLTQKIPVQHVKHQWIVPELEKPKNNLYTLFSEFLMNYLVSLIGILFVLLPLGPLIAALVKLDSKGPLFYLQKRVGKNERVFSVIKFRTMCQNAENGQPVWAKEQDERITRVGKILRKFRLDEITQFINVLKGDMSLIGPRPERPEFVSTLAKEIPFYNYRHLVKPGITGWAQVNYQYGNSVDDALEKLQYDLYWIKNRSFWLDLKIIFKSIKVVLTGFGAM